MNGTEKIIWESEGVRLSNEVINMYDSWIMHSWEKPFMDIIAKKVTQNGGHILELGFGMGLSATAVQNENIKSHTIIEVHPEIYKKALLWSKDKKNVRIILGSWQEVIPTLTQKFDGILHDTHADDFSKFLLTIKNICNEGCIVSFFKNITYDEKFFDITAVKIQEVTTDVFPYSKDGSLTGIFKDGEYKIKSVYYSNGVFLNKVVE